MSNENNTDLNQQIEQALQERKGEIIKGLVEGAITTLNRDLGWQVKHAASEVIDKFIKDEVLPKVQEELEQRKAEIIVSIVGGIEGALQAAVTQMQASAAKNLAQSWNMKKLTEAMFG